jgi:hypothetical protein
MRRGSLNKISYFLIIISAFFTVLSYLSDQAVIRLENEIRMKNFNYQDLDTKIKNLESITITLSNIQVQSDDIILNELIQRNFWIKNLFILESKKEYFDDLRKNLKVLIDDPFVINNIKYRAASSFWDLRDNIYDVRETMLLVFTENIFSEIDFFSSDEFIKNISLENANDFIEKNQDKFYKLNNLDQLVKLLNAKDYKNFELVNWWDLRNFRLLWIEKFDKEIAKIQLVDEYITKVIDDNILDLDIIFYEIKKMNNFKNYFILLGIISQILTLLFLLLLFRSLIKEKII